MAEQRAILFDLDDTLYSYRAFVRSGFRAVACRLAAERGLPARSVLRVLRRALIGGARGRELQVLADRFSLPASLLPSLRAVIREHTPSLRLPADTVGVLQRLRRDWRLGVVTNGAPHIQRRKVAALGLEPLLDTVVFAAEHGDGTGKPAPAAFEVALDRLGAAPRTAIFVGDDWRADMDGATAVGMRTIHLLGHRDRGPCDERACGAHVQRIEQVPAVADRLMSMGTESHAF